MDGLMNNINQMAQNNLGGLAGHQYVPNIAPKQSRVWVAFRSEAEPSKPLAAFPSEALANIYKAGADAAFLGSPVEIIELPMTWA